MTLIKKATIKDLEEIKELNQKLFHHDYKFDKTLNVKWPNTNKEYYKEAITGKNNLALIAVVEDKIVGYLIGTITKGESWRNVKKIAELENMYLEEEHRGKGIGKQLIESFFVWAKEEKVNRIKVVASARNIRAIEVYKKCGFVDYNIVLEKDI